MKKFLIYHKLEVIIIGVLLVILTIGAVILPFINQGSNLTATIYSYSDVVMTIDLEKESEERTFYLEGYDDHVLIGVKHNAIAILENDCPGQDCVRQGYVSSSTTPIICAYHGITINLTSSSGGADVVIR